MKFLKPGFPSLRLSEFGFSLEISLSLTLNDEVFKIIWNMITVSYHFRETSLQKASGRRNQTFLFSWTNQNKTLTSESMIGWAWQQLKSSSSETLPTSSSSKRVSVCRMHRNVFPVHSHRSRSLTICRTAEPIESPRKCSICLSFFFVICKHLSLFHWTLSYSVHTQWQLEGPTKWHQNWSCPSIRLKLSERPHPFCFGTYFEIISAPCQPTLLNSELKFQIFVSAWFLFHYFACLPVVTLLPQKLMFPDEGWFDTHPNNSQSQHKTRLKWIGSERRINWKCCLNWWFCCWQPSDWPVLPRVSTRRTTSRPTGRLWMDSCRSSIRTKESQIISGLPSRSDQEWWVPATVTHPSYNFQQNLSVIVFMVQNGQVTVRTGRTTGYMAPQFDNQSNVSVQMANVSGTTVNALISVPLNFNGMNIQNCQTWNVSDFRGATTFWILQFIQTGPINNGQMGPHTTAPDQVNNVCASQCR